MIAAVTTGGFFIFGTYHWWKLAIGSLVVAVSVICYWLWTGTAHLPEKNEKHAGLGLVLPLDRSGPSSIGYWAVFITMLADLTAFISIVFGYFYFWTIHEDFPPPGATGPGVFWPALAGVLSLGAWALTLLARREMSRVVAKAMALLPEEQRTAIILKEYHGLTFQEIADLLDCPLSTVKTRLYQGLTVLRRQLQRADVESTRARAAALDTVIGSTH